MVSHSCIRVIQYEFERAGIEIIKIRLGEVSIAYRGDNAVLKKAAEILISVGFVLIESKTDLLAAKIKNAVIDLVHYSTYNAMVRNSDYLVERFDMSYQYLSSVFSQAEHITLEKYIILQRIERVKELIQEDELCLSEIAFIMGYSSVQYLSTQFKNITGISVTDFKKDPAAYRVSLHIVGKNIEIEEIHDDAYIRPV